MLHYLPYFLYTYSPVAIGAFFIFTAHKIIVIYYNVGEMLSLAVWIVILLIIQPNPAELSKDFNYRDVIDLGKGGDP